MAIMIAIQGQLPLASAFSLQIGSMHDWALIWLCLCALWLLILLSGKFSVDIDNDALWQLWQLIDWLIY